MGTGLYGDACNMAYDLRGNVNDCKIVMAASEQYREGQDYLAEFVRDKIQKKAGGKIKKTEVYEHFRQWYQTNYGRGILARVHEFLCRRFGAYKQGWHNVAIIYDEGKTTTTCNFIIINFNNSKYYLLLSKTILLQIIFLINQVMSLSQHS